MPLIMELYLYSPNMPSWHGQGQLYLLYHLAELADRQADVTKAVSYGKHGKI
jgi:hypothetical protein